VQEARNHRARGSNSEDPDEARTKDQAKHVGRFCAESHANADFTGALGDKAGNDTVNADAGEEQGKPSEQSTQRGINELQASR
jgi:hypothetical protein